MVILFGNRIYDRFDEKKTMKRTQRVKIVTGLKCNIQCVFCYYRDNLNAPNRSFEDIKKDVDYAFSKGIREVDFSGGEPTLHPKLAELIQYCKDKGIETVCIITNGIRLSKMGFAESLKKAGLDEILFSVHGATADIHDDITKVNGSHEKISRALENAVSQGITVRVNTVVNKINVETLPDIARFVMKYKPLQVNFITVNDWCFAKELVGSLMLKYSDMAPLLKKACDELESHVEYVNVRYIPFCFMKGYERFVCNQSQVPFDRFEWVPRVRCRLEEQNGLLKYLAIIAYGFLVGGYKNLFRKSIGDMLDDCVVATLRSRLYKKDPHACNHCKFNQICDGVENTYAKIIGFGEFEPEDGQVIQDPAFYRKRYGKV